MHGMRGSHCLLIDGHGDGAGPAGEQAYQIKEQDVADALGGIPEYKMRCSNLAPEAIRKAIDDWRDRRKGNPER